MPVCASSSQVSTFRIWNGRWGLPRTQIGSGLLSVMGVSFAFLPIAQTAIKYMVRTACMPACMHARGHQVHIPPSSTCMVGCGPLCSTGHGRPPPPLVHSARLITSVHALQQMHVVVFVCTSQRVADLSGSTVQ